MCTLADAYAIANEWITKNPFAGIKFHEVEVNKQFLSQTEINKIWQKEFKIERLEQVSFRQNMIA